MLAFDQWKSKFEEETHTSFIMATGKKVLSGNRTITYYYCNRSGYFMHNIRALKSQGTSKIDSYCTAAIVLTESDVSTQLQAKICSTHHGHSISLGYLRLQRNNRFQITSKLSQGVTFERILDDIRESIGDTVKMIHLTTRKDIQNIDRSFGLREAKKHQDDATSVSLWVQELAKSNINPIKPKLKATNVTFLWAYAQPFIAHHACECKKRK